MKLIKSKLESALKLQPSFVSVTNIKIHLINPVQIGTFNSNLQNAKHTWPKMSYLAQQARFIFFFQPEGIAKDNNANTDVKYESAWAVLLHCNNYVKKKIFMQQ